MKLFLASLKIDILLQIRQGFYVVSLLVTFFLVIFFKILPFDKELSASGEILAGFVLMNFIFTTFYFMSALILFERSEATLGALTVTPLKSSHYLWAKVVSLTGLAIFENLVVIFMAFGVPPQWWFLFLGMLSLGILFCLLGLIAVARYKEMTRFLFPSGAWVLGFIAVLIGLGWPHLIFYVHPVWPALNLIQLAASFSIDLTALWFGILGSLFWISVAFFLAQYCFKGMK